MTPLIRPLSPCIKWRETHGSITYLIGNKMTPEETSNEQEYVKKTMQQYRNTLSPLPTYDAFHVYDQLYFQNGWYASKPGLLGTMAAQNFFKAQPSDVILASFPKSGTTWLKALLHSTITRNNSSLQNTALSTHNPHQFVPFLESQLYASDQIPDLDSLPSPRLFSTHIPVQSLPLSILQSGCKIIYLCRNAKDNFVSLWYFINKMRVKSSKEPVPLEAAFEFFCNGRSMFGPIQDHVLGYYKASLSKEENKVLFMKYEELMENTVSEVKRVAEFVGYSFTKEEEENGVIDTIVQQCGFDNLSNLEVNKTGTTSAMHWTFDNSIYFRRGKVGDWRNHLTAEMAQRLDVIVKSRFEGYDIDL